ncbi:MAG TPA: lipocalin-like domain-containing protein [Casimicrobiaceae bacterium]|nr:lipocalin-like domain-containing protein [Casimicrobiaceae bacterium]
MRKIIGQGHWCSGSLAAAVLFVGCTALAQAGGDLTGTWTLVSSITDKDGKKTDQFGTGAKGMLHLDSSRRFMLTIIGPDLPRFASGNRAGGTPEENGSVVRRSIAMLGTYSVDASSLTFHVESATFPNWNGTTQTRLLVDTPANELRYVTPTASSGGVGTVTWRRVAPD